MTAKLTLEYDGSGFWGWARQPERRTVEGELTRALAVVLREPVKLTVAGRTDRGVHALGQVVSYDGALPALRSLNAVLPPDVAVVAADEQTQGFSARHDAVSRTYVYRMLARRAPSPHWRRKALWWPHSVDFEALQTCAAALLGVHDFRAFTPSDAQHRRFSRQILRAEWRREGDLLEFWIEANSFLHNMVRVLVGTMLEVSSSRRSYDQFAPLLSGGVRSQAGVTAPAHGLYLAGVRYEPHPRLSLS